MERLYTGGTKPMIGKDALFHGTFSAPLTNRSDISSEYIQIDSGALNLC